MYGNLPPNLKNIPLLTAQQLYDLISQEMIIMHYIGLTNLVSGSTINSPFRNEKRPSFTVRYHNNRWKFRDFATGFSGDILDLLSEMYRKSIPEVIKMVQEDMLNEGKPKKDLEKAPTTIKEPHPREFRVIIRKPVKKDVEYWSSFGITTETLQKFRVYPIDVLFIKDFTGYERNMYVFSGDNIAYCYLMIDPVTNTERYKFYFPKRPKDGVLPRFIGNTTKKDLQGYSQLPQSGELLVLTKSLKDVMVLHEIGIPAVASNGEGIPIEDHYIVELKNRFKTIVSLYDRDRAGKLGALDLRRNHGIPAIMFSRELKKQGIKDASDYSKYYSLQKLKDLTNEKIRDYNQTSR